MDMALEAFVSFLKIRKQLLSYRVIPHNLTRLGEKLNLRDKTVAIIG